MKIKIIGIGGSGCNTVSRLLKKELIKEGDFYALNTDAQALKACTCPNKLLVGEKATGGLGTGMDVKIGRRAAEESTEKIKELLEGADIVFLTCGLGGGSGTSGISVVGDIARSMGILTIGVVTLPFTFEGETRKRIANKGRSDLREGVDSYIIIPNDKILKIASKETTISDAFSKVDDVLVEAILGITDLLSSTGIISVDFADLEEIIKNSGRAIMGTGVAKGDQRAQSAVARALQSPMLDFSPHKARGILFNVGGSDVSLQEVNVVASAIKRMSDSKTKIIFGVSEDKNMPEGDLKVTLIATGVE